MNNVDVSIIMPISREDVSFSKDFDIINQYDDNVEFIFIINDCDVELPDSITDLGKKDNVKLIFKSSNNQGVIRNIGISSASGDYLLFVSDLSFLNNRDFISNINSSSDYISKDGMTLYKKSFIDDTLEEFPNISILNDEYFFLYLNMILENPGKANFISEDTDYGDDIACFNIIKKNLVNQDLWQSNCTRVSDYFLEKILTKFSKTDSDDKERCYDDLKANFGFVLDSPQYNSSLSPDLMDEFTEIYNSRDFNEYINKGVKKFSIIIPCYNVEEYLEEAVESVINQENFNFEKDVEIILVDDGSTDGTAEICKNYVELYPDNIQYFYQENQGQATARNNGVKHATAKYVYFLDADDYLMENTFTNVYKFFESNYDEIDFVSIPIYFFGRKTGEHQLNNKFKHALIVDLDKEWYFPQLSISIFLKRELFARFQFDETLINSEDAVMINKILLEKNKYGLVKNAGLNYRKRCDESSTLDNSIYDKRFYNDRLNGFFKELIEYSEDRIGYVPRFIQYVIVYDIQWMLSSKVIYDVLDDDDLNEMYENLKYIFSFVDDYVIDVHFKNKKDSILRRQMYKLKYDSVVVSEEEDIVLSNENDVLIDELKIHKLYIDIAEIKNDTFYLSGFLRSLFTSDDLSFELIKKSNGDSQIYVPNIVSYNNRKESVFLESYIDFDFSVPLNENEVCEFEINVCSDSESLNLKMSFLAHARLSETSYYSVWGNYIIKFINNKFVVVPYSYSKMLRSELPVLKRIISRRESFWTSGIAFRMLYMILYPFYRNKNIWMFMDMRDSADDSAESLFAYASKIDDGVKKYFALNSDSKDFKRLKSLKNVLSFYSFRHRLMYLFAEKIISSRPDEGVLNPFHGKNVKLYSGLINSEKIYLQHRAAKDDFSIWLRRYDKNLKLIAAVSDLDAQSFSDEGYNYDEDVIEVLGLPRFDNLKSGSDKKQILIAPAWGSDIESDKEEKIRKSVLFNKLNSLINNERLIKLAEDSDYTIIFKPHSKMVEFINLFDKNDCVKIDAATTYSDLFNDSSLLITDYSNMSFDFAYMKKPVVYYHYSDDYPLAESYFDCETMGFGEVAFDENDLIDLIEEYINNNCSMKDEYKNRADNFYKFKDSNNCERVYEAIKKL